MGQPAQVLDIVVVPGQQFGDRMAGEDLGRRPLFGGLPGDGLGAVLAEFEGRRMLGVGPGAAGTIEAIRLVFAQQGFTGGNGVHLGAHGLGDGFQRIPAAGRVGVDPNALRPAGCVVHQSLQNPSRAR